MITTSTHYYNSLKVLNILSKKCDFEMLTNVIDVKCEEIRIIFEKYLDA